MKGPQGKYVTIIEALENNTLYTAAGIAQFAADQGLLDSLVQDQMEAEPAVDDATRTVRQRIRINMGRLSRNRGFPGEGHGMVDIKGQAPMPGWRGSFWKEAYRLSVPKGRRPDDWT